MVISSGSNSCNIMTKHSDRLNQLKEFGWLCFVPVDFYGFSMHFGSFDRFCSFSNVPNFETRHNISLELSTASKDNILFVFIQLQKLT